MYFLICSKLLISWWAQQDSNLRLPPCEGGTLPLSYAPFARSRRLKPNSTPTHRHHYSFPSEEHSPTSPPTAHDISESNQTVQFPLMPRPSTPQPASTPERPPIP